MKNISNTKIIVCCHKKDLWYADNVYLPIQVGKDISDKDLGIQGDNTGDNISLKNKSYCELTGLYWAWKNLKKIDYIGLCHYRRYFNFNNKGIYYSDHKNICDIKIEKLNLKIPNLDSIFNKYDIILSKPKILPYSIFVDYCICHCSEDWRTIEKIILKKYPEYDNAIELMHKSNKLYPYNMMIMKWDDYDKYCHFIFDILNKAEKEIDISGYDNVQQRVWGYIGERLLTLYVYKNKMKIKSFPVYWINENKQDSYFIRVIKYLRKRISAFMFLKVLKYHF
jgi:hypothetical protein